MIMFQKEDRYEMYIDIIYRDPQQRNDSTMDKDIPQMEEGSNREIEQEMASNDQGTRHKHQESIPKIQLG